MMAAGGVQYQKTVCMNSLKIGEVRVSKLRLLLFGTLLAIISVLFCLWLADIFGYNPKDSSAWDYPLTFAIFIPIVVIHELLHGLAAILFGKIHWSDLHFGIKWRYLAAVCHVKVPLSVKAARIV